MGAWEGSQSELRQPFCFFPERLGRWSQTPTQWGSSGVIGGGMHQSMGCRWLLDRRHKPNTCLLKLQYEIRDLSQIKGREIFVIRYFSKFFPFYQITDKLWSSTGRAILIIFEKPSYWILKKSHFWSIESMIWFANSLFRNRNRNCDIDNVGFWNSWGFLVTKKQCLRIFPKKPSANSGNILGEHSLKIYSKSEPK